MLDQFLQNVFDILRRFLGDFARSQEGSQAQDLATGVAAFLALGPADAEVVVHGLDDVVDFDLRTLPQQLDKRHEKSIP